MTINKSGLHTKYGYFEPMPTNELLTDQIGHGMVVFTITGFIFIVFCCFSILMSVVYRKKVRRRTNIGMILSFMSVSSCAEGLSLVLDPYGLRACLPIFLVNSIEQCSKPTVILGFLVLQNYLICSTRMTAKWNKFKSTKHVMTLQSFYLLSMLIIESVCKFTDFENVLRFIYKILTIILLLYTAGCFLCTAFQACLYFDEMKSFRNNNANRNSTNYESDSAVSANVRKQKRLATNRDEERENFIEESTCFLECKKESPLNKYNENRWSSDGEKKSCDYETVIETKTRINYVKADEKTTKANRTDKLSGCSYENIDEQNNRNRILGKLNEQSPKLNGIKTGSVEMNSTINGGDSIGQPKIHCGEGIEFDRQQILSDDIFSVENGYLADMDTISNYTFASSLSTSDYDISDVWKLANPTNDEPKETEPKESTLPPSLIRIRQSHTLRKVVSTGYFITFCFVIDFVFQMFSIFGVYGVFGTKKDPKPWPWFLFQVSHRMVTMTTCLLLLVAVFYVLRNRNKHKRVSRLRLSTINTRY